MIRPPIITIMGHVDHGKTTLLDYIRKANVQAKEAGGITQHIGAYQIEFKNTKCPLGKKITFIDTPGHAAFNKMRQRGAKITDLVVLIVAANDGVKPQTVESIRHIKQSNVPFLVAINKIDIKDIRLDNVKAQLAEHDVILQEFGGEVDVVEISAKTGKGIDTLLDNLLVMAELLELEANPNDPLEAVVIESAKDPKKGSVARVIVQKGSLKIRQDINVDDIKGRVRSLLNEHSQQLKEVGPGSPIEIIGLKGVAEVGSIVREEGADYKDEKNEEVAQNESSKLQNEVNVDLQFDDIDFDSVFGEKEKLKLILRADVKGTLEAILQNVDEDSVDLLSATVGSVTESDLELADTAGALIIAFHIKINRKVKDIAKKMGVKIKQYDIIYKLIEDLQKQMLKILEPTIDEVITGEAEILQVFEMKGERIAGIKVKTGEIKKNDLLHLRRGDEILLNPVVKTMKHGKEDILVVKTKNEAGLIFKNKKIDFQVGDMIVAYKHEDDE